jgi:hypothetical protein
LQKKEDCWSFFNFQKEEELVVVVVCLRIFLGVLIRFK